MESVLIGLILLFPFLLLLSMVGETARKVVSPQPTPPPQQPQPSPQYASVRVHVVDAVSLNGIPNASVSIDGVSGLTDGNGYAVFSQLELNRTYTITASANGYQTNSIQFTPTEARTYDVEIRLQPVSTQQPPTGVANARVRVVVVSTTDSYGRYVAVLSQAGAYRGGGTWDNMLGRCIVSPQSGDRCEMVIASLPNPFVLAVSSSTPWDFDLYVNDQYVGRIRNITLNGVQVYLQSTPPPSQPQPQPTPPDQPQCRNEPITDPREVLNHFCGCSDRPRAGRYITGVTVSKHPYRVTVSLDSRLYQDYAGREIRLCIDVCITRYYGCVRNTCTGNVSCSGSLVALNPPNENCWRLQGETVKTIDWGEMSGINSYACACVTILVLRESWEGGRSYDRVDTASSEIFYMD